MTFTWPCGVRLTRPDPWKVVHMLVVDRRDAEQIAVGAIVAAARDDIDGLARLVVALSREELIGALVYSARFAASMSRHVGAVTGEDTTAALRRLALEVALEAADDGG